MYAATDATVRRAQCISSDLLRWEESDEALKYRMPPTKTNKLLMKHLGEGRTAPLPLACCWVGGVAW